LARAIALAANDSPKVRGWRHWERARILSAADPKVAVADILKAHVLEPALRDRTLKAFRLWDPVDMRAVFDECLAELDPPPAMRAELGALWEEGLRPTAPVPEVDAKPVGPEGTWSLGGVPVIVASDALVIGELTVPVVTGGRTARGTAGKVSFELTLEEESDRLLLSVRGAELRVPLTRWTLSPSDLPSESTSAGSEPMTPLEAHLRQVVERSRAAGAEVVLGGYPFEGHENAILQKVAHDLGCGFVDTWATFRSLLATRDPRELYVRDNSHCTDEGYGFMARLMADEVLRLANARK
jgi:hypothetical protein